MKLEEKALCLDERMIAARNMANKDSSRIDWKKILILSEFPTVSLISVAVVIAILMRTGTLPSGTGDLPMTISIICVVAMPIAGIATFPISMKAGMKKSIIALCFLEALMTVVLAALTLYALTLTIGVPAN